MCFWNIKAANRNILEWKYLWAKIEKIAEIKPVAEPIIIPLLQLLPMLIPSGPQPNIFMITTIVLAVTTGLGWTVALIQLRRVGKIGIKF